MVQRVVLGQVHNVRGIGVDQTHDIARIRPYSALRTDLIWSLGKGAGKDDWTVGSGSPFDRFASVTGPVDVALLFPSTCSLQYWIAFR